MPSVQDIVAKVWSLCDILRDDGITYHQYVNELTYLLFLKMAAETKTEKLLPNDCRWADLVEKSDDVGEQKRFYLRMLNDLGSSEDDRVKQIFANPTTFLHHPENLSKLVSEIDALEWHTVKRESLGDIYEGLLQRNANEKRSGAGQYFTPRPLIETIVNVTRPACGELIVDPALGTAGFLVAAQAYAMANRIKGVRKKARFFGVELVRDTHRLALMNAMLHELYGKIVLGDTLAVDGVRLEKADVIVTNPPFGAKRGAGRAMTELPFPTSNKQLAFLQLIYGALKPGGRAAVVLPDNVLFEEGVGTAIRTDLMEKCSLHTILRLPTGIFYAQGVKTNVFFFMRGSTDSGNTKKTWVYDLRSDMPAFGKRTPLTHKHFQEFEKCYGKKADGTSRRTDQGKKGRFRCFGRAAIRERGDNLDIDWLKNDESAGADEIREPEVIASLIRDRLSTAIDEMDSLVNLLEGEEVDT
jgi:type I restriction enzyme M protein